MKNEVVQQESHHTNVPGRYQAGRRAIPARSNEIFLDKKALELALAYRWSLPTVI